MRLDSVSNNIGSFWAPAELFLEKKKRRNCQLDNMLVHEKSRPMFFFGQCKQLFILTVLLAELQSRVFTLLMAKNIYFFIQFGITSPFNDLFVVYK